MLGPVDYVAVTFEGNNFDGSIVRELNKAVESGTIRVIDMVFVIKDSKGAVDAAEVEDQSEELKEELHSIGYDNSLPLITEQDIEKIGSSMKKNTAAGILVLEQMWAKGLKEALANAGGSVLMQGRIQDDKAEAASNELKKFNVNGRVR